MFGANITIIGDNVNFPIRQRICILEFTFGQLQFSILNDLGQRLSNNNTYLQIQEYWIRFRILLLKKQEHPSQQYTP